MKGAGMKKFIATTIIAGIFMFSFLCVSAFTKALAVDGGNIPAKKGAGEKAAIGSTGQRFVDNGNGTVSDRRAGLMWLKDANPCGAKNWEEAKKFCEKLNYAGYRDWRLPTKAELQGIGTDPPMTWENGSPTVTWKKPDAPFVNVQDGNYWSSTVYEVPDYAWYVYVGTGFVLCNEKSKAVYVWPIRDNKR
jgi:hypothetical protein